MDHFSTTNTLAGATTLLALPLLLASFTATTPAQGESVDARRDQVRLPGPRHDGGLL
jgi:hypothetical protein